MKMDYFFPAQKFFSENGNKNLLGAKAQFVNKKF